MICKFEVYYEYSSFFVIVIYFLILIFVFNNINRLLQIHQKRRKFQKEYHSDLANSQYTYYGAGLISATDRFSENQKNVRKEFDLSNKE